jgi:putative membrane-bound dehydrogenase-like protein
MRSLALLLLILSVTALHAADDTFVHHPDIEITLFAQEPLVIDPVALAFAANGDLFVVEMRDYPYGFGPDRKPGGTVRLLRDTDGDGRADYSSIFAENLHYPTSVTPWRGGILVAAPPHILYLEDYDGDDRADIQNVILDGFGFGVTDGNLSGLQWGIDNRIHGTKGASPAFVHSPLNDDPPLRLSSYDFAFDPDTGKIERTSETSAGFGITFDPFGHCFSNYNIDYLQQHIIPHRYQINRPWLPDKRTTVHISAHGPDARIHPISIPETRLNHPEQAGRFSSASGMAYNHSGIFSPRIDNSIFICDVVCNLVHRNILTDHQSIFKGQRAPEEQTTEFIASRDNAFRPTSITHGPDGAMYLADMQRDVIEHPDYIPAKTLAGLDIRAGENRGRIYRIAPVGGLPKFKIELDSPSPWHSETAQRLIHELGQSPQATEAALHSPLPQARVRALWTLHGLGQIDTDHLRHALADPHPSVRECALTIAESFPELSENIALLLADPHPRVRLQAALSQSSETDRLHALLASDHTDPWIRYAILCSSDRVGLSLLQRLDLPADARRELAECIAAHGTPIAQGDLPPDPDILAGLAKGWKRHQPSDTTQLIPALNQWCAAADTAGQISPLIEIHRLLNLPIPHALDKSIAQATATAQDASAQTEQRIAAIQLLGNLPQHSPQETLTNFLSGEHPATIQQAAIHALSALQHPDSGTTIVNAWPQLSPFARQDAIRMLLAREPWQHALLAGIESQKLKLSDLNLDLEQRRTLLRWSSDAVKKRAAPLITDEEMQSRKAIVSTILASLPVDFDAKKGQVIFTSLCATCHRAGDSGTDVGPNLGSISHRSIEDILTHIIDPNMAINPKYATCTAQTKVGTQFTGILEKEDSLSISLLMPAGLRQTISRADIQTFRTLETSLMPEGLESAMTPQQVRDLIAFLQER